jgi:ribosome-associated protein YbcJ (S4-like RNA binding protein)
LKLGGIVQSNGQAHAIINDQMVGVGEEVAGARVLEIQRRQVILERGGQKIILRF